VTVKKAKPRNYRRERLAEPKARKKARALRNQARRKMGLKVGDPRHVDHKKPLSKGGSNRKSNLRVVSAKTNLAKKRT
jgi:5-methylcytosine-specific restriction endonuclease McrA